MKRVEVINLQKKKLAILFGGRSAEHEVSVDSANNIFRAVDTDQYEIVIIGINHKGEWYLYNEEGLEKLVDPDDKRDYFEELAVIPGKNNQQFYNLQKNEFLETIDVVFPVLHGPYGEDGTIQGFLKNIDVPFVGADVLASAVAMDKVVVKKLLRNNNINIADYLVLTNSKNININEIEERLGWPLFVKPANLGSSVGVKKVNKSNNLKEAVDYALKFDNKVIVEEFINGREIECSVLGNEEIEVSLPGEVKPEVEFYSYEAKYIDGKGATLSVPANLSNTLTEHIREIAASVYKTLMTEGMARVDCFLKDSGEIIVNEVNTIPGFTKISMYPKLWEVSGISYTQLINKLIELAFERYTRENKLKNSYN